MYLPKSFEVNDAESLQDFVAAHPLGTLIHHDAQGLCADHIPLLIARDDAGGILLQGHVARANPLWRNIESRGDVLAVFQDPGMYITPSWYASKAESGKVVPTWNYIAVHVRGVARPIDDATWLKGFLARLTDINESKRAEPWRVSDAPDDYVAMQMKAIVGIEIAVTHWIGKWKVSQNRQSRDIDGVVSGLRDVGDPAAAHMADEVSARRPTR